MDITLQVMIEPPTHDLSYDAAKNAARNRRGDVIGVYLTSDVTEPPNPNGRLGFIHITGVPDVLSFDRIRERLTSAFHDPLLVTEKVMWRKRKWRIRASVIPAGARNTLLTTKELTVTWLQAKPYLRRKEVFNRLDVTADDETAELSDVDVE